MIVRILGEGQFTVDDMVAAELNDLDNELAAAVERGDEAVFRRALNGLLARVRAVGTPVPADNLEPSELILPHEDADLAEVRKLMTDEGFIPGRGRRANACRRSALEQFSILSAWIGNVQEISSVTWII